MNIANNRGQTPVECTKKLNHRNGILKLLFATGENIGVRQVLTAKESEIELFLIDLCRTSIRKHLLQVNPHGNLFFRVPKLGLPFSLFDYLLYDMSVDDAVVDEENVCAIIRRGRYKTHEYGIILQSLNLPQLH